MRRAPDLLDVLARDHRLYDRRCQHLSASADRSRDLDRFAVDVLAHEAIEQLLLHPLVAARLPNGPALATARVREAGWLDHLLDRLVTAPAGSPDADDDLERFHQHLVEHTDREEIEVFPLVHHVADRRELTRLGQLYLTVQRELAATPIAEATTEDRSSEGTSRRSPLLRLRDTAATILVGRGVTLPPGVGTGTDPLEAPLHVLTPCPTSPHRATSPAAASVSRRWAR